MNIQIISLSSNKKAYAVNYNRKFTIRYYSLIKYSINNINLSYFIHECR